MLHLTNVARAIDGHRVLSEVTLRVDEAERVAVLGPTGSGKTSLLRLIMGLDSLDAGEVRCDGQLLASGQGNQVGAERRGFSLVFERTVLLPFLDVQKNILLAARADDEGAKARLEEVTALLRLQKLRNRSVQGLSAGEQQCVALARSLFVRPKLLLLDEPFRNLDRPLRDWLLPALVEYCGHRKIAAVLVTHDRDEAFAFSRRIFLLRDGRLLRNDTPEQLYRHPAAPWEAKLLGDCNLLPVDVARSLLGWQPSHAQVRRVLVRPEHIAVSDGPPCNATLEHIGFFGFYQTLTFRTEGDVLLLAKVFGDGAYVERAQYQLRLTDGARVEELAESAERGE